MSKKTSKRNRRAAKRAATDAAVKRPRLLLGRFEERFRSFDVVEITNYATAGYPGDFRGMRLMVATVHHEFDRRACQKDAEHQLGDDGWVKFWYYGIDGSEEHPLIPDNKLWLYQPRGKLVANGSRCGLMPVAY